MADGTLVEAWLRTYRYSPGCPLNGLADIELARQWVLKFVDWNNGVHLHSGLSHVTPEQRYSSRVDTILMQRQAVCAAALAHHPLRWKRPPRVWQPPTPRPFYATTTLIGIDCTSVQSLQLIGQCGRLG